MIISTGAVLGLGRLARETTPKNRIELSQVKTNWTKNVRQKRHLQANVLEVRQQMNSFRTCMSFQTAKKFGMCSPVDVAFSNVVTLSKRVSLRSSRSYSTEGKKIYEICGNEVSSFFSIQ